MGILQGLCLFGGLVLEMESQQVFLSRWTQGPEAGRSRGTPTPSGGTEPGEHPLDGTVWDNFSNLWVFYTLVVLSKAGGATALSKDKGCVVCTCNSSSGEVEAAGWV